MKLIKLENPTLLAAIAYIVLAVIVMLPVNIGDLDPKKKPYNIKYRIILLLFMLIPISVSLYSIDCMLKGKCIMWSYINSIFICVWVMVFLISAILFQRNMA